MQSSQVSCIEGESHAFQCNFMLSCSHKYFSRISTLLEGNSTVVAIRSAYNCKIPSVGVNVPGFNKSVCFKQFEKCSLDPPR